MVKTKHREHKFDKSLTPQNASLPTNRKAVDVLGRHFGYALLDNGDVGVTGPPDALVISEQATQQRCTVQPLFHWIHNIKLFR